MQKRELGDSGVEVTTVALGSWLTYSGGIGREQTEACTRAAFEAGITLFDTANVYGTGASERAWGEILSDYPRDAYVLATKVYFPMARATAASRASRSSSRSTARWSGCGPTTSTSTSATATTTRCRCRRRWAR